MRPNLDVLRSAVGPMLTEHGTVSTTEWQTNPDTGFEEEVLVTKFAGPCLVRPEATTEVTVGGTTHPVARYDVTLPAGSDVVTGDVLVLDDVPYDPALTGAQIKLTDVPLDAWQVARFCKGERAG